MAPKKSAIFFIHQWLGAREVRAALNPSCVSIWAEITQTPRVKFLLFAASTNEMSRGTKNQL